MSIKRYYGDNGELLRYEMSKEMKEWAARYYKKTRRAQLIDAVMPFVVIVVGVGALVVWYLINN